MVNSGALLTSKMEFFDMKANSIAKSSTLYVPGISIYVIVIIRLWLQCRCTSLVTENFYFDNCFYCFFHEKSTWHWYDQWKISLDQQHILLQASGKGICSSLSFIHTKKLVDVHIHVTRPPPPPQFLT